MPEGDIPLSQFILTTQPKLKKARIAREPKTDDLPLSSVFPSIKGLSRRQDLPQKTQQKLDIDLGPGGIPSSEEQVRGTTKRLASRLRIDPQEAKDIVLTQVSRRREEIGSKSKAGQIRRFRTALEQGFTREDIEIGDTKVFQAAQAEREESREQTRRRHTREILAAQAEAGSESIVEMEKGRSAFLRPFRGGARDVYARGVTAALGLAGLATGDEEFFEAGAAVQQGVGGAERLASEKLGVGFGERAIRSVASSVIQSFAAAGTTVGTIASFAITELGDSAVTGHEVGLRGIKLLRYAGAAAAIEGGVTSMFQKFGLGGMESALGNILYGAKREFKKQTIGSFVKNFMKASAKVVLPEILEENTVEIGQSINDYVTRDPDGNRIDPEALTAESIWNGILDVTAAAALGAEFALVGQQLSRVQFSKIKEILNTKKGKAMRAKLEANMRQEIEVSEEQQAEFQQIAKDVAAEPQKGAEFQQIAEELAAESGEQEAQISQEQAIAPEEATVEAGPVPVTADQRSFDEQKAESEGLLQAFEEGNDDAGRRIIQEHQANNPAFEEAFQKIQQSDVEVTAAPDVVAAPDVTGAPLEVTQASREIKGQEQALREVETEQVLEAKPEAPAVTAEQRAEDEKAPLRPKKPLVKSKEGKPKRAKSEFKEGEKVAFRHAKDIKAAIEEKIPTGLREQALKTILGREIRTRSQFKAAMRQVRKLATSSAQKQIAIKKAEVERKAFLEEKKETKTAQAKLKKTLAGAKKRFGKDFGKFEAPLRSNMRELVADIQSATPTAKTRRRLEHAIDAVKQDPSISLPDHLQKGLSRLTQKPISEMDAKEAGEINDAIRAIVEQQKDIENQRSGEESIKTELLVNQGVRDMESLQKTRKGKFVTRGPIGATVSFFTDNIRTLTKKIDAGKKSDEGAFQKFVHKGLKVDPQREVWKARVKNDNVIAETAQRHGLDRAKLAKENEKTITIQLDNGVEYEGPKGGLVTIALMEQSKDGQEALRNNDYFVVDTEGKKTRSSKQFTENDIKKLTNAADQDTVDFYRDLIDNHLTPEFSRINEKVNHVEVKTVPSYWQIVRHAASVASVKLDVDSKTGDVMSLLAAEKWGSLHERTGGNAPIEIRTAGSILSSIIGHQVVMDSMAIPGRRLSVIMNDVRFRDAVNKTFGEGFLKQFHKRFAQVYGQEASIARGYDPLAGVFAKMRSLGQKSVMAANVPMMALQPGSLVQAGNEMGPGILKKIRPLSKRERKIVDSIKTPEFAPLLDQRKKLGGALRETGEHRGSEMVRNVLEGYKARELSGKGVSSADQIAINRIILEAYDQATKRGMVGKERLRWAGEFAEDVVDLNQPTFDVGSRTGFGASNQEIVKWLGMWRSFTNKMLVNTNFHLQETARVLRSDAKARTKAKAVSKAIAIIGNNFGVTAATKVLRNIIWKGGLTALGLAIAGGGKPPEDKEEDGFLIKFLKDVAENAVGILPFGDRVFNSVKALDNAIDKDFNQARWDLKRAVTKDLPPLEILDEAVTAVISLNQAIESEKKGSDRATKQYLSAMEHGINAVSKTFGTMLESLYRDVKPVIKGFMSGKDSPKLWSNLTKRVAGEGLIDLQIKVSKSKGEKRTKFEERLEKAKQAAEDIKEQFTFEEAIKILRKRYKADLLASKKAGTDPPTSIVTQVKRLRQAYGAK